MSGEEIACVQTSPISFVSACNKGNRRRLHAGKGGEGERSNEQRFSLLRGGERCVTKQKCPLGRLLALP